MDSTDLLDTRKQSRFESHQHTEENIQVQMQENIRENSSFLRTTSHNTFVHAQRKNETSESYSINDIMSIIEALSDQDYSNVHNSLIALFDYVHCFFSTISAHYLNVFHPSSIILR